MWLVVAAFDFRLTIESCVGPTCVTLARRLGGEGENSRAFVAMQAPRRCREPRSKTTCPLADPDTVANISFGIGDRAAGSSVSCPGVVSVVLRPKSQGIKWNKIEFFTPWPLCKAHERF
jgi:hypothetical protein